MAEPYKNKQVILDRIRHFAAGHYGLGQVEFLDPVSNLFLESLSEEIYSLSGEIEKMEERILNKLSSMLVSEIGQTAFPSHTVMHAKALAPTWDITIKTPFSLNRNYNGKQSHLSFYPVCNTRIYQGDVKYFIYKGQFYSTEIYGTKTLLARSKYRDSFPQNTCWIGIALDDTIAELEHLSFYINLMGSYDKNAYLKTLAQAIWKFDGQELSVQKGLYTTEDAEENEVLKFYSAFNRSNLINKQVKNIYDKHYLTIKDNITLQSRKYLLPDCLKKKFDDNLTENIKTPLLWIEIAFPAGISQEVIQSIQISINTFPVICKKLVNLTQEVRNSVPVIPLRTGANESFLSICSLVDSQGKKYYDIPVKDNETGESHMYSLRHGGYERFNERDASEYLSNAIQTLDSEASSFFRSHKDMKTEMKQIRHEVNLVLKDLKTMATGEKDNYEVENYLLLDQDKEWELYFLEYWLINYDIAKSIKAYTAFYPEYGMPISPSGLVCLMPVTGGSPAPTPNIKYSHYKKSLTARPLLVTKEDIAGFCMNEFQDMIDRIDIKNGYEENIGNEIGFQRTTDIYLKMAAGFNRQWNERDMSNLKKLLHIHSPATFRYRIFID